jgi:hypothetical protein
MGFQSRAQGPTLQNIYYVCINACSLDDADFKRGSHRFRDLWAFSEISIRLIPLTFRKEVDYISGKTEYFQGMPLFLRDKG